MFKISVISGDHQRHLETILLVVQANVATAGYLLEKFVDLSPEPENMDAAA